MTHRAGPCATDGDIAAINLESARRGAWARFARNARAPGVAEAVLESERLAAQFPGDLAALDRLQSLAAQFAGAEASFRSALVEAAVACDLHRFEAAREHLALAAQLGGPNDDIQRQSLAIDQACGTALDRVLAARREMAASGRLEDLVPLGALLADLEQFGEADDIYRRAYRSYDAASPFPLAWTCFQLGMLWGELTFEPDPMLAEGWYRQAIAYLPSYAKARVHLAETLLEQDRPGEAEVVLSPALSSADPEVRWRLADVLAAQGRQSEAETQLRAARMGFEDLLGKHTLAFADHAAEFYAGSGADPWRALGLARLNAANRPTRHASRRVQTLAALVGEVATAPNT
jgi:hypothetical protein